MSEHMSTAHVLSQQSITIVSAPQSLHSVLCQAAAAGWLQEYVGQEGQPRLLRSHRRPARRSETRSKKQQAKGRRRQTGRAQAGASAQGGRTLDKYAWLQVRNPPPPSPSVLNCCCIDRISVCVSYSLCSAHESKKAPSLINQSCVDLKACVWLRLAIEQHTDRFAA